MLKIFDRNHNPKGILNDFKDCIIEETLETGLKTLSFKVSSNNALVDAIEEQGYIQSDEYEWVIKEYNKEDNDYFTVQCKANIEDLEGTPNNKFESSETTVKDCCSAMIAPAQTWNCEDHSGFTKKRTIRRDKSNCYELLGFLASVYQVELEFDTLHKIVKIFGKRGQQRGVFVNNGDSKLKLQSTSYDFYTRIYPYGKKGSDGKALTIASVNGGKEYIDNNTYSDKVISYVWEDERYTIAQDLYDDAKDKLAEMAKPKHSYQCSIVDLGKKDIQLGDTITIMDSVKKIRDTQRVVQITHYPFEPENDTVELANTMLSFTQKQSRMEKAAEVIENNTDDAGVINSTESGGGSGHFEIPDPLTIGTVNATNITSNDAKIQTLEVEQKATIKDLETTSTLTAPAINSTNLQADTLTVTKSFIGVLTSDNFKSGTIDTKILNTSQAWITTGMLNDGIVGTAQIADSSITDAKIDNLSANKITAGTLSTDRLIIHGSDKSIVYQINNAGQLASTSVDTIDGDVLTDRTVTADKIVAHAITANEIASKTITANEIKTATITSAQIAANTITAAEIASGTISSNELRSDCITTQMLEGKTIIAPYIASSLTNPTFSLTKQGNITGATITGSSIKTIKDSYYSTTLELKSGKLNEYNSNGQLIGWFGGRHTWQYGGATLQGPQIQAQILTIPERTQGMKGGALDNGSNFQMYGFTVFGNTTDHTYKMHWSGSNLYFKIDETWVRVPCMATGSINDNAKTSLSTINLYREGGTSNPYVYSDSNRIVLHWTGRNVQAIIDGVVVQNLS